MSEGDSSDVKEPGVVVDGLSHLGHLQGVYPEELPAELPALHHGIGAAFLERARVSLDLDELTTI